MRSTYGWKRAFRLFRSDRDEVREEIRTHLAAGGKPPGEEELSAAVDATLRARGPRSRWPLAAGLDWLVQDVRFALRALRRRPGFGASAVLILGLAIAANAAVFAVVSAYLVRALPYPVPERVVFVTRTPMGQPTMSSDAPVPSGLNSIVWPRRDSILEYSAAWELDGFGLVSNGDPVVVGGAWVTAGFFPILGARPSLGRVFTAEEVRDEAAVAVISHGLWTRRYGADTTILGRPIRAYSSDRPADTETFTIIGVLSEDFWSFVPASDLYVPLRGTRRPVLARLAPGVTPDRAALHLTGIARERLPEVDPRWSMHVTPLQEALFADLRPSLRVLGAGALLLLLIAGVNLTLLLLIRAAGRELELSIRSALGAGRSRIFRQLAVEGLVLAVLAGMLGVLAARMLLSTLGPLIPGMIGAQVPGGDTGLRIDTRVIGWTVVATAVSALVFGAVPLLLRRGGFAGLRSGRGVGSSFGRRTQTWLVAAEVALSLALLAGAGLLARSALDVSRRSLGFRPEGVAVASLALREPSYPDEESRARFFEQLLEAYATNGAAGPTGSGARRPDRGSAAASDRYPYRSSRGERFAVRDVDAELTESLRAIHHVISEDYFEVLDIPIVSGRSFTPADDANGEPVIVISRALADRLWPDGAALGRYVRTGSWDDLPDLESSPWRRVVGIAGDVRTTRTGEDWPDTYVPYRQRPRAHMHVLLRADGGGGAERAAEESALARLEMAVRRLDPGQPVNGMSSVADSVDAELQRPRFMTALLMACSAFALCLALVGLHAVVSYAASTRRREVAIRVALGATRRQVDRVLVRGAAAAVGLGTIGGLILALAGSRLLESQLYGLPTLQPATLGLVTLSAILPSTLSVWLTARRAGRADPADVLREE